MKTKQDIEGLEDFFSENSMEALTAMSGMVNTQQNIALNLTTLVLEHCSKNQLATKQAKKEVFDIYKEASDLVREQLDL